MRRMLIGLALATLVLAGSSQAQNKRLPVDDSLHNLSPVNGQGADTCRYCHSAHKTAPVRGLWNHQLSTAEYQFYTSSSYKQGAASLPTDSPSRLCLSCHDGTVALGSTYGSSTPLPTNKSLSEKNNLGTDLRSSHPFGFDTWVRDNTLRDELFSSNPRITGDAHVKLYAGRIECSTCHEPHTPNIDPKRPDMFLAVSNENGGLCLSCHDANKPAPNVLNGWLASAHATSGTKEGTNYTGYSTVAESACTTCHAPHNSGAERLLRDGGAKGCLECHANAASQSHFAQTWVGYDDPSKFMHPVFATGHKPDEDLKSAATPRHSDCWDCHNPHAARPNGPTTAPAVQPVLAQTSGIDKDGNPVTAANQYEVCFKCHGDSANKPQGASFAKYGYTPTRQVDAHNVRLDFNSAFSRHNVVQARSGNTSPAFRNAMLRLDGTAGRSLTSGFLYCTDCHNNDKAQESGGNGPNGPHVSSYEHLLERRYDMNRPAASRELPVMSLNIPPDGGDPLNGPFALCNKCHDVARLLSSSGDTAFKQHAQHVVNGGISCSVCHAPHGVQSSNSTAALHAHSINLDLAIVNPEPATNQVMIDTANRTCTVACHMSNSGPVVHNGVKY
ncbi:MAG TPA: cytochrome c3 family protein [Terriglobales bacterium]|nr:cytochrome c3 family protein [Terriglobales bacterium]